jgi:transcriptional regulator with XRE-family HTH domain
MRKVYAVDEILTLLGYRLHQARLARNEPMAVLAERLGVSERTVRSMERGLPTVQIGTWLQALWLLDELEPLEQLLRSQESVLDRARRERQRPRTRASRRPT